MAKSRMTALVLGAAGAVIATALVLHRGDEDTPTPTQVPAIGPARCGLPAPSHVEATLDHGRFTGALSATQLARGGGGELHGGFDLVTDASTSGRCAPLDLAFVIDRSGSMEGDRLDHAKHAARGIVAELGSQDRVALVQYDDDAQVVVASLAMDAAGKAKIDHAIDALASGGGTNLEAGLELGRHEVERAAHTEQMTGQANRVILLSDGRANVGVVDPKQIAATARDAADHGVRVTSVGIGLDFNEDLMEAIAEAGRGNYHYVKDAADLEKTIASELASVQATVATGVELRLRPACAGVQLVAVHGYESHRDGDETVVPMPDLFGGDDRKLLVSMRVPDGELGSVGVVHAELVYRDTADGATRSHAVDLGIQVTDDHAAAVASIDQDVMAQVWKLEAAESMRQAAQAYDSGDSKAAAQILDTASHHIAAKREMYKVAPAKAAPALSDLDDMVKATRAYAPGSAQAAGIVKETKAKARVMAKH